MTKEEKIKEAYLFEFTNNEQDFLKRFESLKFWIDKNGWFSGTLHDVNMDNFDVSGHEIRPKSLDGIENNNGWIKLESHKDLPKSDQIHYSVFSTTGIKKSSFNVHQVIAGYQFGEITHYKPIINDYPIY